MIAIGPISGFIAALVMVLTIVVPSASLAGASFFLMGAGPIVWVVSTTTLRQTVTPDYLLGRVSATNSLAYGARPIGAALGALIGGFFGAEACLICRGRGLSGAGRGDRALAGHSARGSAEIPHDFRRAITAEAILQAVAVWRDAGTASGASPSQSG